MASSQSSAAFLLEQIAGAGEVTARKMFGEFGIYCNGKIVAFICDDDLYVKPTDAGKGFIGDFKEGYPYPGAKPHLLITADRWDDSDFLTKLIVFTAAELPAPKPKTPRKRKST